MNKKLLAVAGLIVIVAAIAVGVAAFGPKETDTATNATPTASASPSPTPTATTTLGDTTTPPASGYKDGTYSATGSYNSPGGTETVSVTLTVKDGVVTDSTATTTGNNPTGKMYQQKFLSGYKTLVVGKSIDDIKLSKVSGSSLTSGGFNNAVTQIKAQAKA